MGKLIYPPLDDVNFEFVDSVTFPQFKARIWDATNTLKTIGSGVGVDPGRNFGVTIITPLKIRMIHGVITKGDYISYGVDAIKVMGWVIRMYDEYDMSRWRGLVEGAAYKKQFGQTGLAYVRFGFYVGIHQAGIPVDIKPPASIRKVVFGNGDNDGREYFPTRNANGVASLGCALYGVGYRCPKRSDETAEGSTEE